MKTLGLLGGMSWESTVTYYQEINRRVRAVRGGLHSAPCIVYSFDFAAIEALQRSGDWDEAGHLLDAAAAALQRAGADAVVLCTNTMHSVAQGIEAASRLPLLHIADPTAERIVGAGCRRPGLLGTRFTMEKAFYAARLRDKHGLETVVPDEAGRTAVHDIIYAELCNGIVREASREVYYRVIADLKAAGADCLILGCTEIGLLVGEGAEERCGLPVFDTTKIHAIATADWAMEHTAAEGERKVGM
ncbi:aspartate racemase [Chaetomidium leptoderma]|uniref:Aspartate racemase n=1 Tax=Chaetomidium leptoderma TaxID=669021 RepID=A0AAN6VBZ0_9PEZI|nr:aspartate racemase [Chaetomidium leptoderma]